MPVKCNALHFCRQELKLEKTTSGGRVVHASTLNTAIQQISKRMQRNSLFRTKLSLSQSETHLIFISREARRCSGCRLWTVAFPGGGGKATHIGLRLVSDTRLKLTSWFAQNQLELLCPKTT